MEIPHEVFTTCSEWTKPPLNTDVSCDKRFVSALLLALTEEEKLLEDDIPQDVMNFVEGTIFISMFSFDHFMRI